MESIQALWEQQAQFEFKLTIEGKDHFFRYNRLQDKHLVTLSYIKEYGGEKVDFPEGFRALIDVDNRKIIDTPATRCPCLDKMFVMAASSGHFLLYENQQVLRFEPVILTKITATAFDLTRKLEFN